MTFSSRLAFFPAFFISKARSTKRFREPFWILSKKMQLRGLSRSAEGPTSRQENIISNAFLAFFLFSFFFLWLAYVLQNERRNTQIFRNKTKAVVRQKDPGDSQIISRVHCRLLVSLSSLFFYFPSCLLRIFSKCLWILICRINLFVRNRKRHCATKETHQCVFACPREAVLFCHPVSWTPVRWAA